MGRKAQLQLSWDLVRKRPSTEQKAGECEARDRPYTHTPTVHTHARIVQKAGDCEARDLLCIHTPMHAYTHPPSCTHIHTHHAHIHLPCTHMSPSRIPLPPSCTPTPAVHTHAPSSVCVCRLHWVSPEFPKCQHRLPLQSGPPAGRQEECGHQGETKM